jgi:HK97 family phage major capsid protein
VARSHRLMRPRWESALRALDVDTSGEGGTWVPTGIGATMHERVRAAGKVAALFARIDLPTNPWKWPIEGSDATAYRVGEPTGDTETKVTVSTPGTVAATFDAEIFGGRVLFSRSLEADSAIAILPFTSMKLVRAFVDAEEKAIIDGDGDGTHQDSDVGASTTDARTAWDGLRKRGLANASAATTTSTVANLMSIRALMGKWGVNPADLAYIVGVSAYHDLYADSNLLTVDKMGPNATILNGMVGSIGGVPVIVSEHVRENVNASGVYDGITTTKTYNICVNRGEWAMGQRMALDVEVDDSIYRETFQRVVVGFMREDFQNIGDASTNDDTAIGYNVTP